MKSKPAPSLALFLGFLVPGGGHFYAGRNGAGLAWFAVVTVLTFVGWPLVGPGFFSQNHLDFAIVGVHVSIPTAIPEIVNFLETMAAQVWLGKGIPDMPLMPTAAIGFSLTATAGVLNALAMADAHWICFQAAAAGPEPEASARRAKSPAIAAMFAFLLPGGGHLWLGRRGKGWLAGGALVLTMLLGELFAHGTVLQRERDQYFWSGEILLGLPAIAVGIVNAGRRIHSDIPLGELGLLCTTVAGLLNILLMIDAYTTAERDLRAASSSAAAGSATAGSATAGSATASSAASTSASASEPASQTQLST